MYSVQYIVGIPPNPENSPDSGLRTVHHLEFELKISFMVLIKSQKGREAKFQFSSPSKFLIVMVKEGENGMDGYILYGESGKSREKYVHIPSYVEE